MDDAVNCFEQATIHVHFALSFLSTPKNYLNKVVREYWNSHHNDMVYDIRKAGAKLTSAGHRLVFISDCHSPILEIFHHIFDIFIRTTAII